LPIIGSLSKGDTTYFAPAFFGLTPSLSEKGEGEATYFTRPAATFLVCHFQKVCAQQNIYSS
jgi:hypothetical protein